MTQTQNTARASAETIARRVAAWRRSHEVVATSSTALVAAVERRVELPKQLGRREMLAALPSKRWA